ncbi:MAG: hypothetical protein L0332_03875 [Chloroflexi bacterium]|nr:hypothetical protein [Chloroflexota bacterium]MCI0644460.1 hypothetical protein [Chloroflexota bacterium]MCI0725848.1 hypothetical protein [Chloroflexota bacterium]
MTPTLFGRWQTRVFLLGTVGLFITFFISLLAWIIGQFFWDFFKPPFLLFLVIVFGFLWDVLYNFAQKFRWDRDWPPAFQFIAGFLEMFPVLVVALFLDVPVWLFLLHYWSVWLATFIMSQGPMRILFPRWRYRGGQWL